MSEGEVVIFALGATMILAGLGGLIEIMAWRRFRHRYRRRRR